MHQQTSTVSNLFRISMYLMFGRPYADSHSTQQVLLEQINTFAISRDEYMRGLSKKFTAKIKKALILIKMDLLHKSTFFNSMHKKFHV